MKKYFILSFILLLVARTGFSQNPVYLISQGGTVNICGADFFDSGHGSNYSDNENYTMTFHSTSLTNTHVKVDVNTFDVEPGDTLFVYDGSTIAAPLIGKYNNNHLPPAFFKASIYNLTGDMTFNFISNGSVEGAGWFFSELCIPQCQDVIASIDTTQNFPLPNDSSYIDICIGSTIHFAACGAGPGVFPQNNILYAQDSSTTLFIWNFGDGTVDTGRLINHLYTLVRGYDVTLTVIDTRGCFNSNAVGIRVRISANPYAHINPIPDICSSTDTSWISLGYNSSSIVVIAPINSAQEASAIYDSTTFIPDGPNCNLGQCYNTFVTFHAFLPGATITSAADILSICVNMEHSYCGDLGFTITCPNGTSVQLDPNIHSGSMYMGEPYGGNNHGNFDSNTNPCDAAFNPHGTGWTYCWSQIYPQVSTLDAASYTGGFGSTGMSMDSTNTVNHTHYFTPNNSLSGLIGCPLNGTWNLQVCDDWAIDNGYVFWWELNLDPALLPVGWGYSVPIDTVTWTGAFFTVMNDTTIRIIPDSGGVYHYTVTVTDVFGCSYDTTLTLQVVQTPHVNLGPDTTICGNGVAYNLNAGPGDHYQWSTMSNNQIIPVTTTGDYMVTVENYNLLGTLTCAGADTVFVKVLALPSVDLGPDICITHDTILDALNNGFHYLWNNGDTTQTINISASGTYSVTVAEEFGHNCQSTSDINVTMFPVPHIDLGPDSTICSHQTIKIEATDQNGYLSNYPYTVNWSPFPATNANDKFVVLSWLTPGTYHVVCRVTGCATYADSMLLTVKDCPVKVPNIFTPNNDNFNDVFGISGIKYYPNSTLTIFNRWGRKVFESNNYDCDEESDGTVTGNNCWNGKGCADGVYYYVLILNYGDRGNGVQTSEQHGTVTILR